MLCELIGTTVVLKSLTLVLLIRMFVFMKELMFFYLRIISSFVLVEAHIHTLIQQGERESEKAREKRDRERKEKDVTSHEALRYKLRDILFATSQALS